MHSGKGMHLSQAGLMMQMFSLLSTVPPFGEKATSQVKGHRTPVRWPFLMHRATKNSCHVMGGAQMRYCSLGHLYQADYYYSL